MYKFDFLETKYRSVIANLALVLISVVLVIIGNEAASKNFLVYNVNLGSALANIGAFFLIIGLMQAIYDYFVRKKFFEEIITSISSTRSIYDLGIVDAKAPSSEAKLSSQIQDTKELTLVFSHSKRFISRYISELEHRIAHKKKTTLYCNRADTTAVNYYVACGRDRKYVEASIDELVKAVGNIDKGTNLFRIIYIDVAPKYSLVLTDNCAHMILSTSSEGEAQVPLITARKGSALWEFVQKDLSNLKQKHLKA